MDLDGFRARPGRPPATVSAEVLPAEHREDLERLASRSMARLSTTGSLLYPVVCALLGYGVSFPARHPVPFFSLLAAAVLVAAWRLHLKVGFERQYPHRPARWRRLFGATLTAAVGIWTVIFCWALLDRGLDGITFFGLLLSAVMCTLAINVYTPSLLLVRSFLLIVMVPVAAACLALGSPTARAIGVFIAPYGIYLWIAGRRLNAEYWERAVHARLHLLRAAELEGEKDQLQQIRRRLERALADLEARNAELEAKSAEMERFTYAISHDLKSPLITVRGFLGLVEKDAAAGDFERMRHDMERIHAAVEKMTQLLDELLELSRIGRLFNPPEPVPLAELAREAAELVAGGIAARGVEVEIAPDLPVVDGDRPRLLQVLQNLIDNAVKFMGAQPEPRIEIGARRDDGEVVCYVRDNGVGVDPRYHERVFGLFERLDQQGTEGTGIGLALVRRIVEVHGGRIWVESDGEGRGSTFCFTLPGPPPA